MAAKSVNNPWIARARRRAKIAASAGMCMAGSLSPDWDRIVTWVEGEDPDVTCDAERDVRMFCVELVASHLRTGHMDVARMLQKLQQLADFAMKDPDSPASPVPVPSGEDPPVEAARQTA